MALRSSSLRRKSRDTGPGSVTVELVLERAGYSCEVCDHWIGDRRGVDWSIHHRRPRQMGGTRWAGANLCSNLMLLCGSGVTGCHSVIESHRAGAVAGGWLVLSREDPARIAVLIKRDRWCYLTNEGQYSDDPPERAA